MKTTQNYIISGGAEGKNRLNILSGILHEHTKSVLERNGVATGISFLDVGCGGGNVSVMAAQMIGNNGRITAIDFDEEIISLNRKDAETMGVPNISYHAMSAYDIGFHNEFDVAYTRFLLSHLQEPLKVLEKIVHSLKPGGRIIAEDVHFSGHFCYPQCSAFDRYVQLYTTAGLQRGQNPEIGTALFSLFKEAGVKDLHFEVTQPAFHTGEGKWMAYITLDKIKDVVIQQGLADATEVNNILSELEAFTKDESTIISLPRIFSVWGVKQ